MVHNLVAMGRTRTAQKAYLRRWTKATRNLVARRRAGIRAVAEALLEQEPGRERLEYEQVVRIAAAARGAAAWLGASGPPGDLAGSPAPDLVLEDRWSFLCVRPVSEAGRRWAAGTLLLARRRFGRVAAADPRSGAVMVGPHFFRAVVGAAEAAGLVVRVSEP